MLDRAGLTGLIDCNVDGNVIVERHLRPRPAPDILLAACDELAVDPRRAASFETTGVGIAAAREAGFGLVIGVGRGDQVQELRAAGADLVVTGLEELLDREQAA
jgi:beta-phosphoglucomutase-like phosphatase (HAD superfamily)